MFKTRLLSGIFLVLAVVLALRAGGLVLFFTLLGVSLMGAQEILMAMGATKSGDRVLEICTYLGTCL
ncbi:MAG: phosphatidate cytidylyltransferase, partial [Blautia sp.]|nr:phosphatidate cytidylyltransferase [Blautia sp.]